MFDADAFWQMPGNEEPSEYDVALMMNDDQPLIRGNAGIMPGLHPNLLNTHLAAIALEIDQESASANDDEDEEDWDDDEDEDDPWDDSDEWDDVEEDEDEDWDVDFDEDDAD